MENTSGAVEENRTQIAEPPLLREKERNQLGPATNQLSVPLYLHFSACHFSPAFLSYWGGFNTATMLGAFSTTVPGNHSWHHFLGLLPLHSLLSRVAFYYDIWTRRMQCKVKKWWTSSKAKNLSPQPQSCELHCTARSLWLKPGNVVGQQSTLHNGTCCVVSWERVGEHWNYCARHHYTGAPLAEVHQGTREAEKVFHWDSTEKTPTLNSANASILYCCRVVAELLMVGMAEAASFSSDKSQHRATLPLT